MSKFPSIEDFDESTPAAPGGGSDLLEASDLLSREQALLGEDAVLFQTGAEDQVLNSEADKFPEIDMIGGGNEAIGPGGTITGSASPYLPADSQQQLYGAAPHSIPEEEEEPEVIREWRERQTLQIQHRDSKSASKKDATIAAAQQAIDDFYEAYNMKKDRSIAQTRKEAEEFIASRENTVAGGTSWERIAKLVDLSDKAAKKGSDKTRFRELLLSLRKDESAPGATVVV